VIARQSAGYKKQLLKFLLARSPSPATAETPYEADRLGARWCFDRHQAMNEDISTRAEELAGGRHSFLDFRALRNGKSVRELQMLARWKR